jgi:citronellol/citronellal dehydrogenase
VGPRVAVMSEGFEAVIGDQLPRDLFETREEIVEAVVALCDCGAEVTGQITSSLKLIADWSLSVRTLDGTARV